jgi:ribonuclease VapC
VDSSALVAIAEQEPGFENLLSVLAAGDVRRVSAANLLETWMVVDRRGVQAATTLAERVLDRFGIEIVPVTLEQVEIAREAWRRYGRGSGHPARLNFGDCFAYALAKDLDEPLLFVGNDFAATDIVAAMASE